MATAGDVPKLGFGAGAIKYTTLFGFDPRPGAPTVGKIPTMGFTAGAIKYVALFGFESGAAPAGTGARSFASIIGG